MSLDAHTEIKPDSEKDPRILVQVQVITELGLSEDLDQSALLYVEQGYSELCRQLMETNTDVQKLLAQGNISEAAKLLIKLLLLQKGDESLHIQ